MTASNSSRRMPLQLIGLPDFTVCRDRTNTDKYLPDSLNAYPAIHLWFTNLRVVKISSRLSMAHTGPRQCFFHKPNGGSLPKEMQKDRHTHFVSSMTKNTYAVVLAGGRGSRLYSLTDWRAKPAVPFGGKFRIIDFVLSNCVNSGIRRIGVATQYKSHRD